MIPLLWWKVLQFSKAVSIKSFLLIPPLFYSNYLHFLINKLCSRPGQQLYHHGNTGKQTWMVHDYTKTTIFSFGPYFLSPQHSRVNCNHWAWKSSLRMQIQSLPWLLCMHRALEACLTLYHWHKLNNPLIISSLLMEQNKRETFVCISSMQIIIVNISSYKYLVLYYYVFQKIKIYNYLLINYIFI